MFSFYRYSHDCIQIDMNDSSFYFVGKLPIAFRKGKVMYLIRNIYGERIDIIIKEITYGRNCIVLERNDFAVGLHKAYKQAIIEEMKKIGLKTMKLEDKNVNRSSHARKVVDLTNGIVS